MTITTKTGDKGTSTWQGKTVDKDSALLTAVGDLDELQALLLMIKLDDVAADLHKIMGEIAYERKIESFQFSASKMEEEITRMENEMKRIKNFLLFENEKSKLVNWVRTVARRAERSLVALNRTQQIDPNILKYINRLSDYLFMLSRRAEEV